MALFLQTIVAIFLLGLHFPLLFFCLTDENSSSKGGVAVLSDPGQAVPLPVYQHCKTEHVHQISFCN